MPWFRSIWIRFRKFARKRRGFDARQCDKRRVSYTRHHIQETGVSSPASDRQPREGGVVVRHERAAEAKIGEKIRDRYHEVAEEELPEKILDALADLNQRLNRRDGD